jgi:hypothetical protein
MLTLIALLYGQLAHPVVALQRAFNRLPRRVMLCDGSRVEVEVSVAVTVLELVHAQLVVAAPVKLNKRLHANEPVKPARSVSESKVMTIAAPVLSNWAPVTVGPPRASPVYMT